MRPSCRRRVERATSRRRAGALLLALLLAGCSATTPPSVPARFADAVARARTEPWPRLCAVPPRPAAEVLVPRTAVREETRAAGRRAAAESARLRRRLGLSVVRPAPLPPAPPTPRGRRPSRPRLVEMAAGRTVRAETVTGRLADLLDWLEEAVRPRHDAGG